MDGDATAGLVSVRPLNAQEEALWMLQALVPDRGVSNVGVAVCIPKRLEPRPLEAALAWLVARHEALRGGFGVRAGRPHRVVRPAADVAVTVELFATTTDELAGDMRRYAGVPFDLAGGAPVRLGLYDVADGSSVICLVAHHIVVDHTGLQLLLRELTSAYKAFASGTAPAALPVGHAAIVPPPEASLRYWRQQVHDVDPRMMLLHGSRTSGPEPAFSGGYLWRRVPAATAAAVAQLRRRLRVTPNIIYLSAYYLLLLRHGSATDLVAGVMLDARRTAGPADPSASGLGYRVDTVPLRVRVDPAAGFAQLTHAVRDRLIDALAHPGVSYEMLADGWSQAATEADWWRSRLFRHVFNFRGRALAFSGERLAEEPMRALHVDTGLARFDLELTVEADPVGPLCHLVYSTEVHDHRQAEDLLERYLTLLRAVAAEPDVPVSHVDIRSDADRAVVAAANRTERAWPAAAGVSAGVFERLRGQIARTPAAVAVTAAAGAVSYAELGSAAAAVRDLLVDAGVGPGDIVAVAGPRGARTAAALLGVWAAGAAYLPLDPSQPAARLVAELDDSRCRVILDGQELPLPCRAGRTLLASVDPAVVPANPEALADTAAPGADTVAYLIYTSGSTGRPKGVRLTHANLDNVVRHFADLLPVGAEDAMVWLTTMAFDISALELWLPLTCGSRVVVVPDQARVLPESLFEAIDRERVTIVQATPTTWRLVAPLAGSRLAGLRVLCGGEPLPPSLARQLIASGCRLFNVYGPTETTIWSTVAEIMPGQSELTIGRPIANTRVHVLDRHDRELPVGVPGELAIAGAGVAVGYLNLPEQTAASFPELDGLGRVYRTGDVARWRHDGQLELLGRADRQVKLNGHRVELTEIEAVLQEHSGVRIGAAVLCRPGEGDAVLAGYLVPTGDAGDPEGLRERVWRHCAVRLPRHAVPTLLEVVEALPLTISGKVDYRRLTARAIAAPRTAVDHGSVEDTARDQLVARFLNLWREALGLVELNPDAHFFLIGGHSLLAISLLERASEVCGFEIPLSAIFRAPTPAALARLVRSEYALESETAE
ncbi:amino acid adenylation domain-containing protein [Dactylosporangium roseum]|uniref:Amino acid adenylation domain-containing protein n=1 Tax=Dactylosporangium roseum TaxID=47989 RepID=A0ABY5ZBD5_9ACTN|nr:amino acid adenylation domain-containing protein [Dactylosporangium roseum]UWZ39428.1 amino acid adenylation domain-containing protein [Dactylosporangium roseum]